MASYLLGDLALSSLARGIAAEPPESDSLTIGFELSGGSDIPTLITGISVQVIAHQDPRELTALYSCWIGPCSEPTSEQQDGGAGQRGSEQFARTLYADLSSTGETFETKSEGTAKFPFKVTRTDVEYFDLSVTSQNCNCTWKVNVFWTQGTRSGRQQINGSNQPFKTVEDTVVKQYCYDRSNFRGYANVSDAAAVRRLCYP